jgi:hypothetical protein
MEDNWEKEFYEKGIYKMGKIALAIVVVGLCFYEAYLGKTGQKYDLTAGLVAFISSLILLINWKD